MRLDWLVAQKFSLPRRKAQEYVRTGRVEVDGAVCREPGRTVEEENRVTLHVNRPPVEKVRSPLQVLFEDAWLIVVLKPAGLLTLPTEAHEKETLLSRVNSYLLHRYKKRPYAGIVHRLDKDTSGSLVLARDRKTLRALQELFQRHDLDREYLALVEGRVGRPQGTVSAAIVADRGDRRRGIARRNERGKEATTHFEVVERLAGATLLRVRLETGRTHQIRIHLAQMGHPVVGDAVYRLRHGPVSSVTASRQMLHAARLSFRHPWAGQLLDTQAPLPDDFQKLLRRLRK